MPRRGDARGSSNEQAQVGWNSTNKRERESSQKRPTKSAANRQQIGQPGSRNRKQREFPGSPVPSANGTYDLVAPLIIQMNARSESGSNESVLQSPPRVKSEQRLLSENRLRQPIPQQVYRNVNPRLRRHGSVVKCVLVVPPVVVGETVEGFLECPAAGVLGVDGDYCEDYVGCCCEEEGGVY